MATGKRVNCSINIHLNLNSCSYGIECLFRFYSYGLQARFRPEVYRHFMTDTVNDVKNNQLYGVEKFWAFLKYYKYSHTLEVDQFLKEQLAKYKNLSDFAIDVRVVV